MADWGHFRFVHHMVYDALNLALRLAVWISDVRAKHSLKMAENGIALF